MSAITKALRVIEEQADEIERLNKVLDHQLTHAVGLDDEIERLQKECEDKDRVIRAGINTAKRLRAVLDEIESYGGAQALIAREALREVGDE